MNSNEAIKTLREALDSASDLAGAEAYRVHETYAGYKPDKHRAADADVELMDQASAALEVLRAQLAARIEPAKPVALDGTVIRAIQEARDTAMRFTVEARIPECGEFGAIAQNLSWALDTMKAADNSAAPQPIAQPAPSIPVFTSKVRAEFDSWAHANGHSTSRDDRDQYRWGDTQALWREWEGRALLAKEIALAAAPKQNDGAA